MNNNEIDINLENDNIDIDTEKNEVVYRYVEYDDTEVRELIQENADDITNIQAEQEIQNDNILSLQNNKVNKVAGKDLSTNDYTNEDKSKLDSLQNYDDTEVKQDIVDLETNKADKTEIPDVSNFITKTVDDLVNYYKKSETYTQAEVNNLIGSIQQFHYEIVQALPQTGANNILYLLPRTTSETNNVYDEYVYANNSWEKIGSTQIDLSNYYTKSQVDALISNIDLSNYYTKAQVDALIPTVPTNVSAFTNDAGYLTQHQDISGKENMSNKVTNLSSQSTDTQYPSAKCVYDIVGDIETILARLTTGGGVS